MAAPKTKKNKKQPPKHNVMSLEKRIRALEVVDPSVLIAALERIEKLEETINIMADQLELVARKLDGKNNSTPRKDNSIQKVESHNDEEIPMPEADGSALVMNHADKMRSLDNVVRILAPSYLGEDGRHTLENLSGVCGFKVTKEMQDEVYANIRHEGGLVVPIE